MLLRQSMAKWTWIGLDRLIPFMMAIFLLGSLPVWAHGPEMTAVVSYSQSGDVTLRLIDPYGTTVTGDVTAQVDSGAQTGSKPVRLREDSQGTYRFTVDSFGAESKQIAIEVILWNEIYRTTIMIDPVYAGQEFMFGLLEYPQVQRSGWGLVIYAGVTLASVCLLGLLFVRRTPG